MSKSDSIKVTILVLAWLAFIGLYPSHFWALKRPYPYPTEALEPTDVPIEIGLKASRRFFEGQLDASEVRYARYTNSWPDGFQGWGRGYEPAGFPHTDLTRSEIETLLAALANDLKPVPAEDSERDGFANSDGQVILQLNDGTNALLLIGQGMGSNLLLGSTVSELKYNTSTRTLFHDLRARARVSPEVPLLYPELSEAEEDALGVEKLGDDYQVIKRFVAASPDFEAILGAVTDIRRAKGRNLVDPTSGTTNAVLTFDLVGVRGRGVVQASLYRNTIRAELIVTKHESAVIVGRFITASGSNRTAGSADAKRVPVGN
jgi:hypothetical protein